MAMNPIIKFCTLFGLLAVELAITIKEDPHNPNSPYSAWRYVLAVLFFIAACIFVWRSFYAMRIVEAKPGAGAGSGGSSAAARREEEPVLAGK